MTVDPTTEVAVTGDLPDRWWPVGPVLAVIVLGSVGAFELLILLTTIAGLTWVAVNGLPADFCPAGVTCPTPDIRLAFIWFLIPLAILGTGMVMVVLAFRGPKTVSRRRLRITLSVAAIASPVLAWMWIFH